MSDNWLEIHCITSKGKSFERGYSSQIHNTTNINVADKLGDSPTPKKKKYSSNSGFSRTPIKNTSPISTLSTPSPKGTKRKRVPGSATPTKKQQINKKRQDYLLLVKAIARQMLLTR